MAAQLTLEADIDRRFRTPSTQNSDSRVRFPPATLITLVGMQWDVNVSCIGLIGFFKTEPKRLAFH
jgi:hypothetical protein